MTQDQVTLFARCGMLLYGNEFVAPLAHALGVADRTVLRWARGRYRSRADEVPPDIWRKLHRLLADEEERIGSVAIEVLEVRQRLREEGRV